MYPCFRSNSLAWPILCLGTCVLAAGCSEKELPGEYWNITVSGAENLCTGNGTGYTENFEYRVVISINDATMYIGDDNWANGILDGCSLHYESIAWSDFRDGYEIQWVLTGDAVVNPGGPVAGCVEGLDWQGTEVFTVTNSAHPAVQSGCTYTLDVFGEWTREVVVQ